MLGINVGLNIMSDFEERKHKRRKYEREQEDLQLLAQEKEKLIKSGWLKFSLLSLLIWVLYGMTLKSFKFEQIDLMLLIALSSQIFLLIRTLLKRHTLQT